MTIHYVTTAADVDGLIEGVCDPDRIRPWCIVSTPFDSSVPRFDLAEIETQVGDLCAVFVLPTGDLSSRYALRATRPARVALLDQRRSRDTAT